MVQLLPRYLPVLRIQNTLSPLRTLTLIQKMRKIASMDPVAIALIVDIHNQAPVQADKLLQTLRQIRKQKSIPIYGFTGSFCSPEVESYYLLSGATKIYTSPTSVFTFRRKFQITKFSNLLNKLNIKRLTAVSHPNLLGQYLNSFTPSDTPNTIDQKQIDITERMVQYSIKNREEVVGSLSVKPEEIKQKMLGEDLIKFNLADGYGLYENILKQMHPNGRIFKLQSGNQRIKVLKIIIVVTSPILVLLFLFKVALKWSIIFYAWIKARASGKNLTLREIEQMQFKDN